MSKNLYRIRKKKPSIGFQLGLADSKHGYHPPHQLTPFARKGKEVRRKVQAFIGPWAGYVFKTKALPETNVVRPHTDSDKSWSNYSYKIVSHSDEGEDCLILAIGRMTDKAIYFDRACVAFVKSTELLWEGLGKR
jgi:hypothetical protein